MSSHIRLCNPRLAVEINPPGVGYQGPRFDWSGFITQVTLDGAHTFCVPESLQSGKGSGGIGLCNEFGIDQAIGYDEAGPGELFPKLGIGLLSRPDQRPYDFFFPYEIARPFPVVMEIGVDWARFTVEPLECCGYAARLVKTVSLQASSLEIAYRLENVGRKPLQTNEYVHNFNGIDRQVIRPEYRLRFPYRVEIENGSARGLDVVNYQGEEVCFTGTPSQPFYFRTLGFSLSVRPQWELTLQSSGVGLCEIDDFPPVRVGVWGMAHVISTEVFVEVNVRPGETQQWKRQYKFRA